LNLAFYIARRYLFAKKSHNVVNLISAISVFGVVVATIAMVCTLSVFNGFKSLTTTIFSVFDPELKIQSIEGKVFDPTTDAFTKVCNMSGIQHACGVLQENALVSYGDRQEISVLKGVDTTFRQLVPIDTAIIDGSFLLREGDIHYAVIGQGLAASLGVNPAFAYPMEIIMPPRLGSVNMANVTASMVVEYVSIAGVYRINQPVYDEGFMLFPIDLLREMLDYEKEVTALEIKLTPGADIASVKRKIFNLIGDGFTVKDRFEQQEDYFKITQVEKWVTFFMLCFILVLALFNVLGSLAMLMIEKEEDVKKLRSMGADIRLINRIFLFEGWMISLLGAALGLIIGIGLCLLQQHFGLIRLGETAGTFIVDSYPVVVEWSDVFITFITVVAIGFVAVLYPVHYLGKKRLYTKLSVCLLIPLAMAGCGGSREGNRKEIAVSIEPLCYFGQKIAGDDYTFFSVVPVGRSPETFDPTFREMHRVGKSEAFFYINKLGFEQVLIKTLKANQSDTQFFDLSEGMEESPIPPLKGVRGMSEEEIGAHGLDTTSSFYEVKKISASGHSHCEHGDDPHIWTSFAGAYAMSENFLKALSSLNPIREEYYKTNYLSLKEELEQLERDLHKQLESLTYRGFVIYHPALTYFAEEFNLTQYSLEEDGKEPSPASIRKLIEEARAAQVKVVFVQMEFDRKHAEQIAYEIGARIVMINPLDPIWDEQMKRIVKALATNGEID